MTFCRTWSFVALDGKIWWVESAGCTLNIITPYTVPWTSEQQLPLPPPQRGLFQFVLPITSSPTPSLKRAERGSICQFRCRPPLVFKRKWKFSASETSDCKETGGRKGCTSCNVKDHSAIKQWRNQKFTLNSSGTQKVISFHLAQKQILPFSSEEKDHKSLPRDVRFFLSSSASIALLEFYCIQKDFCFV